MWRVIESDRLLGDTPIDLEIDLKHFKSELQWNDVEEFLLFLSNNYERLLGLTEDAKIVLLALFQRIYRDTYSKEELGNVHFNLTGIDFKGHCQNINLADEFDFDLFFFPYFTDDVHRDIGSFVWRANFRNGLLLGVYCDRI